MPAVGAVMLLALAAQAQAAGDRRIPASERSREVVREVRPRLAAALRERGLQLGAPVFLRIFKAEAELEAWVRGEDGRYALFRRWPICRQSGALGPKLEEGDGQSPEGFYRVRPAQMNPRSRFHLSFDLGFPNAYDRRHGRTGSFLMVHGGCASIGCYAMTHEVIEQLWTLMDAAFRSGQRQVQVHAYPFRPTPEALAEHEQARWAGFWRQLARGHRLFERTRVPPAVTVRGGRYVLTPRRP